MLFLSLPKAQEELPWWFSGKESACQAGDLGSIPGSRRSPGEENGNPLQYACLENPMDRAAWRATVHGVAKASDTAWRLNDSNKDPGRLQQWTWVSQQAGAWSRLRPVDPKAPPFKLSEDSHHLSHEGADRATCLLPSLCPSQAHVPVDAVLDIRGPALSMHTFSFQSPPPPGILANLCGHTAICSTPPLLGSSEGKGDSFKQHQVLGKLTDRAASPGHPGRTQKQV